MFDIYRVADLSSWLCSKQHLNMYAYMPMVKNDVCRGADIGGCAQVLTGASMQISFKSDIYSLGITLGEIIKGEPPEGGGLHIRLAGHAPLNTTLNCHCFPEAHHDGRLACWFEMPCTPRKLLVFEALMKLWT